MADTVNDAIFDKLASEKPAEKKDGDNMVETAPTVEKTKAVAKPKAKKPKTAKPDPLHPKYSEMIATTIKNLKDRRGTSRQALVKTIMQNYKVSQDAARVRVHLNLALTRGVTAGTLKMARATGKGSKNYKLGDKALKVKKPVKKVKVVAKKPVKNVVKKVTKVKKTTKKTTKPKTTTAATKKKTIKKVAKKPTAKKPAVKKTVKSAVKKPVAKKTAEKKTAGKKPAVKKPIAKKTNKPVTKKTPAKKAVPAKKPATKKTAAVKPTKK